MPKDAVVILEATRQKLIKKLLEKKLHIEDQLKGLGHDPHLQPNALVGHSQVSGTVSR